jgi:hypothetical protein
LQKLLNPFPQIYDKPFSADVGTLLHDGATIPRLTSGSRVVVASTVESAAFSVSFADIRLRATIFRGAISSRGKNAKRRFADASRYDEIPTIFNAFSLNAPSSSRSSRAFASENRRTSATKKVSLTATIRKSEITQTYCSIERRSSPSRRFKSFVRRRTRDERLDARPGRNERRTSVGEQAFQTIDTRSWQEEKACDVCSYRCFSA